MEQEPFPSGVIQGDCMAVLKAMPPSFVHCAVTSPPFYKQRDYQAAGQYGQEETLKEYVQRMVDVGKEVRRVLRGDGTFFLQLGDSYAKASADKIKPKDMMCVPWSVALALRDDGWYLRSDCVWEKNGLPQSVRDRPVTTHEYVFLLAKSQTYFYDCEAVKVDGACGSPRNLRTVWKISVQPTGHAHCAPFPEKLAETCILAGTSQMGCCPKCRAPYVRILEDGKPVRTHNGPGKQKKIVEAQGKHGATSSLSTGYMVPKVTVGWEPSCGCKAGSPVPCVVMDPFCGSGTTGMVAKRTGREFVGIDLNPSYCALARKRIAETDSVQQALWLEG